MRLTKRNPETGEYEYKEKAKTLTEFRAQRKAVVQRLGEYEDKASDLAEEIFGEIDEIFERQIYESMWLDQNGKVLGFVDVFCAFECWRDYIKPELKKKYTEVAERRKGVENSPVDCLTPNVTDQKGEGE